MTPLISSVSYSATFLGQTGDVCSYRIEERNGRNSARAFTGIVSCTQRASAKGWLQSSDERKVEYWCKFNPDKLPQNGGTVKIDLSEVAIE